MEGFEKLSAQSVTFDSHYVGSLPCMPARRELHTGRYNFLHRCWGPIEPFDESVPQILKEHGIYTHLVSDHAHYWEDGGCTYHTRYNTWEGFRGQEGDMYKGQVANPQIPEGALGRMKHSWRQEWVNRSYIKDANESPLYKVFDAGLEFIETNHKEDNWFLQIEPFDPHEPTSSHMRRRGWVKKIQAPSLIALTMELQTNIRLNRLSMYETYIAGWPSVATDD